MVPIAGESYFGIEFVNFIPQKINWARAKLSEQFTTLAIRTDWKSTHRSLCNIILRN